MLLLVIIALSSANNVSLFELNTPEVIESDSLLNSSRLTSPYSCLIDFVSLKNMRLVVNIYVLDEREFKGS